MNSLGQISGILFSDNNGNGVLDPTDTPAPGKVVNLCALANGKPAQQIGTALTDASGKYAFTGLPDGAYAVVHPFPAGYQGSNDGGKGFIAVTLTTPAPVPPSVVVNIGSMAIPTPPAPVFTTITQAGDVYAHDITIGDFTVENQIVTQGGLVQYRVTDGNLVVKNCCSLSRASNGGTYFIIAATNPCKSVTWDNSGLTDQWICSGPDAAARFMGQGGSLAIINVDIVTLLHDPTDGGTGTKLAPTPQLHPLKQPTPPTGVQYVPWKQGLQIRAFDVFSMTGTLPSATCPNGKGRIVGLMIVGAQAGDDATQHVGAGTITHYGMQNIPTFTDASTYGAIVMKDCWKIDANGNALRDAKGNLEMWVDQSWTGTK